METVNLDATDKAIINHLQRGFPICDRPYRAAAEELGISEDDLLMRLERMKAEKILTRFGPMFHAAELGGSLSLAALNVPEERFEEVTELVNRHPEIAHNYERAHALNMWFVIACETPGREAEVIREIEAETGLHVFNMPKVHEFFVGLHFEV